MKRNLGGERDLDYIIAAALRGMDRACLDYGVKAGLIFCLAREFDYDLNEILVQKAEKYRGARRHRHRPGRPRAAHARARRRRRSLPRPVRARARRGPRHHRPHRRDHAHRPRGRAGGDREAQAGAHRPRHRRRAIARRRCASSSSSGIVLEICPTSNLRTHAVADLADLRRVFDALRAAGVRLTINTDGTYLLGTTLRKEFDLLLGERIVSQSEALAYIANARAASFLPHCAIVSSPFRDVVPSLAVNQLISFATRWPRTVVVLCLAHRRCRRRRDDAPAQRRGPAGLLADQQSRRAPLPGRVAPLRLVARGHRRRRGAAPATMSSRRRRSPRSSAPPTPSTTCAAAIWSCR